MNTSHYNLSLSDFLIEHQLIDQETHDLIQAQPNVPVRDLLIQEKVLDPKHLDKIEQLLSGATRRFEGSTFNPEHVHHIPYRYARTHRVLVVERDENGVFSLISDQIDASTKPELPQHVAANHKLQFTDRSTMDNILDSYHKHHRSTIESTLEHTLTRVRTHSDYGSQAYAMFFPEDRAREIAEDIATKKLFRQLISYAQTFGASTTLFVPHHDSLIVYAERDGTREMLYQLPLSILPSLILSAQYACDLPLREIEHITQGLTHELHPQKKNQRVVFIPTVDGISITLGDNTGGLTSHDMGMGHEDLRYLIGDVAEPGLIIVSGRETSGKTYGYYQLLDYTKQHLRVVSLEQSVEYSISGVEQLSFSKRPDQDISYLASLQNTVLGMREYKPGLLRSICNLSLRHSLVVETTAGLADIILKMRSYGIPNSVQKKILKGNLLSYQSSQLMRPQKTRIDQSSAETIERYVGLDEYNALTGQRAQSIRDGQWFKETSQEGKGFFSRVKNIMRETPDPQYVRSYCQGRDLQNLIEIANTKELQDAVSDVHKHGLVRAMLPLCAQGVLGVNEILSLLRS